MTLKRLPLIIICILFVSSMSMMTIAKDSEYETSPNYNSDGRVVSCSSSDGLMDSAWPMFQHDPQHTGRTDVILPSGNQGVLKWKYLLLETDISSNVKESTPVIDNDGVTYTGNYRNHLHAVYPDGLMKWKCELESRTEQTGAIGADGTIYYGVYEGWLFALNPNGTIKWQILLAYDLEGTPTIGTDGTIYIGCDGDKTIYAIHPNGTIKWEYKTGGSLRGPALDSQGNIYIGCGDGFFYSLYPNGTLRWKIEFGFVCGGKGPVIDGDTVYFTTGGALYARYMSNGTRKWMFDSGYWSSSGSPAVGFDGELYFGCGIYQTNESGEFICVNPDGTLRWRHPTMEYCISSPVVTGGGVVIVGDHAGFVYAFSTSGELLWRYYTAKQIYSSFSVAEDGTIYFTSWDGYLHALEVVERENHSPETPVIEGREWGLPFTEYPYTFHLMDPDGDSMFYKLEHEGAQSLWTGPYESGVPIVENFSWGGAGTYEIRVKARDLYGYESDWGSLVVTMPKTRVQSLISDYLFQHYTFLQNIMNFIQ